MVSNLEVVWGNERDFFFFFFFNTTNTIRHRTFLFFFFFLSHVIFVETETVINKYEVHQEHCPSFTRTMLDINVHSRVQIIISLVVARARRIAGRANAVQGPYAGKKIKVIQE